MRSITAALLIAFSCSAFSPWARAQIPPPVDLGIQNLTQDTQVWCWAAVAQQIIFRLRGPADTPAQCALVAMASGVPPFHCCSAYVNCFRTGHLHEIQNLIFHFGGATSSIAPPTDPFTLYGALASGRAVIMAVQSSPFSGHVVVIRGMAWVQTPFGVQPVLYINDPMSYFTEPVLFTNILQYWGAAIVVN